MWEVKVAGLSAFVRGQVEWLRGSQAFDSAELERASISLDLIDAGVFLRNTTIVLSGVHLSVI